MIKTERMTLIARKVPKVPIIHQIRTEDGRSTMVLRSSNVAWNLKPIINMSEVRIGRKGLVYNSHGNSASGFYTTNLNLVSMPTARKKQSLAGLTGSPGAIA